MTPQKIKVPVQHDWHLIQVFDETLTMPIEDVKQLEDTNGIIYDVFSLFKINLNVDVFPFSLFKLATGLDISPSEIKKAYKKSEYMYLFVCQRVTKKD